MAMKKCRECGKSVSTKAKACVGCGAPVKRGSSIVNAFVLLVVAVVGLAVVAPRMRDGPRHARADGPPSAAAQPKTYAPKADPTYPFKLVTLLSQVREAEGAEFALQVAGEGWHKSKVDGVWNAVLRRTLGPNEVSCLLESTDPSTVQRVELEAEFHEPGKFEADMLLQFALSAQVLMHPDVPTREFAEAVTNKSDWSNAKWEMKREPYANGGFGLMLRNNPGW
jgi:hypothetical protein